MGSGGQPLGEREEREIWAVEVIGPREGGNGLSERWAGRGEKANGPRATDSGCGKVGLG